MSWLGWGSATNPQYEELVEKTCSALNLPFPQSENMADMLEVTDLIRSKAVQPKLAMQSLKRRVTSPNGRVQMYALSLTDTCIKNGGDHFLVEIASKEFVDEMSKLIKSNSTTPEVKQMAIKLYQQWAVAFRDRRDLSYLVDVYNELKNSGTQFPAAPAQASSHLFSTITAPEWVDSDVCMRCRTAFTFTNRKHHCRNCGLVFDQACSAKNLELPHFGITTPVRVCDSCYAKGGKPIPRAPAGPAPAIPGRTPRSRADYDADLQRAIELSLADSKGVGAGLVGSEPPIAKAGRTAEDDDEELRLAIEASLREMEARPSAPNGYDEPEFKPLPTFDLNPRETETILTFSNTLDQMAAYGERDLRRFPHAHVLYEQAYGIGGKLHRNVEEKATKQQMLAEMQAKLSEAVSLYGSVLDGQQAYSARKQQEQQQARYSQYQAQQYPYSQYQPQQPSPYGYHTQQNQQQPYVNGYAQSPYAHASPQAPSAASGLYPSMPPVGQTAPSQPYGASPYAPPLQQHPSQQVYTSPATAYPGHIPQQYNPSAAQGDAYAAAPSAPQQYQPQPVLQRASSLSYAPTPQSTFSPAATPAPSAPSAPTRSLSSSYTSDATPVASVGSAPTPIPGFGAPSAPPAAIGSSPANSIHGSAPPVDMASHPSMSPRSDTVALPGQGVQRSTSFSYAQQAQQVQGMSPQKQVQGQGQYHQHPPQQQQQQQQQQQHQQQQPTGPVYYETSFPAAPAAVFPDAPAADPDKDKVEQAQPKEAMLIEL